MTASAPEPDPEPETHWLRLGEALDRLLDADVSERDDLLAELTPSLRSSAIAALAAIEERDTFHDLASDAAARYQSPEPESLIGQHIGDFALLRLLGIGGMSWVYLAQRDQGSAQQQVALKRLRPDLASPQLRERFMAEQRIIVRLQHPGIARLIAAGMDDAGVPWLATELVEGQTLMRWCDERRLSKPERLRLFVQVCEAVSAAHRRLIVHRDLKPGNVLVNADGAPKLLDFGISRLIESDTAGDERTRAEWRMLTPEYAAPEQLTGAAPSVAMDVYALGVMLYELLTGTRPPTAPYRRADEAPLPPPSAAITPDTAAARGLKPQVLRRRLRGDLDAIVLHALEFDPERRYARVDILADDLRAVLEKRPISLRRRHWAHAGLRFVQRNWLACSLAAVAMLAALGGVAGVVRESLQREQALERAEMVEQFLLGLFRSASLSTREAAQRPVSALLEDGARDAATFAGTRPALAGQLLLTIATVQDQLDQFDAAIRNYDAAAAAAQSANDPLTAAAAQVGQAYVRLRIGLDPARIDALLGAALPVLREHAPDSPKLAHGMMMLAMRDQSLGHVDQAETGFLDAIALLDRVAPNDVLAFQTRSELGVMYELNGRLDEAVAIEREAWAGALEMLGREHITTLRIGFNLGKALGRQGALSEANTVMQDTARPLLELLPPDHTDQVSIRAEYARVAALLDRLDEAEALLVEASALADQRRDLDGTLAAVIHSHLGALRFRQGRPEEALEEIDRTYRWLVQQDARDFFQTCWAQGASARLLFDLGRTAEAQERLHAPSNCGTALDEAHARAAWAEGHRDEARTRYAALLTPRDASPQAEMGLLQPRLRYAVLLGESGAREEARAQLQHILDACAAAGITSNPELRQAKLLLAASADAAMP